MNILSLAVIVGVVLTRKDICLEWFKKIKSTFIYNDLWEVVCEGKTIQTKLYASITFDPKPPTSDKELSIWKSRDKKALVMITTIVNEELTNIFFLQNHVLKQ